MDCTRCTSKGCRLSSPCFDRSSEYIEEYETDSVQSVTRAASKLVDDGRAGTLTRLEEIKEYAKLKSYRKIGVAYCYGLEKEAELLRNDLEQSGFQTEMTSCTVDSVPESKVNTTKEDSFVSCNPLGQANVLNHSGAEFAILMGLCLGHDILIQKSLKMDYTTWIVKDRVTSHRPMDALPGYHSKEDRFLEQMDTSFHLVSWEEMAKKIEDPNWKSNLILLDLRGENAFLENGIQGSIQSLLTELPARYRKLLPAQDKEIIIYCNGGMQSLYAVMYLSLKGYKNVKSLGGGYANYIQKTRQ